MNNKETVFVIVGATATGKSDLAVSLAKKVDGEIISADSMQIYKYLNIGTAKITKSEMQEIPHHMLDIKEITESYSVAEYKEKCYKKIEEIIRKGKTPIVVGGTGLYINAIVNNMSFVKEDKNIHDSKYENSSLEELLEILKKLDPESIDTIDKKNKKRIIRAIDIAENGGLKSNIDAKSDLWNANDTPYNFFVIYIDIPRDMLYYRIEKRIDLMDKEKLLKEAKLIYDIRNLNVGPVQAIGYKEFFGYLDNTKTLEECIELLKLNSRHYAKRQITWFKKLKKDIITNGTDTKEKQIEEILKEYNERSKR